jgi:hypothetical protein
MTIDMEGAASSAPCWVPTAHPTADGDEAPPSIAARL